MDERVTLLNKFIHIANNVTREEACMIDDIVGMFSNINLISELTDEELKEAIKKIERTLGQGSYRLN